MGEGTDPAGRQIIELRDRRAGREIACLKHGPKVRRPRVGRSRRGAVIEDPEGTSHHRTKCCDSRRNFWLQTVRTFVMRMFERPSTLLTLFLVILTPAVSSAREASAPLNLTEAEISNMKSSYYHIERVATKYQPYIITYDDQEVLQLEYDTRKEAQARVDEINKADRLDRPGVRGRRNRKVGIREFKRNFHEIISRGSLERIAKKLGIEQKADYKAERKYTRRVFVWDFAEELLGRKVLELRNLKAAAASPDSRWRSLSFSNDPAAAFQNAQDLANTGKLVVVVWRNPDSTSHVPGHSAVVVPSRQADGGLFDAKKGKWGMKAGPASTKPLLQQGL
jgi:hypothetical protein